MGFASLSAASSCVRSSLFCTSGIDLLALIEAISPLDLIWWLGKGLGLLVDAGKDDGDIRRDVVVFGEARKAIFLDQSLGLHLQFWIRSVWIRAMIELRHVLGHSDEAQHLLLCEFDLLHLLRSGDGGMKEREREKR